MARTVRESVRESEGEGEGVGEGVSESVSEGVGIVCGGVGECEVALEMADLWGWRPASASIPCGCVPIVLPPCHAD